MSGERNQFGFTPDWRARVPFWLILPKALLLVGVPVWIIWAMVMSGFYDIYVIIVLGFVAAAAGRHIAVTTQQTVNYQRRLSEGKIVADAAGLRILPPYGKWRAFPWSEVKELRNTTVGGLFAEAFTTVEAGGVPCAIPPYVDDRDELLRLIRFRANLTSESRGWWATVYQRP